MRIEDGFYDEEVYQTADGPARKQKVLKTIPPEVCRSCLAVGSAENIKT